ncbi:DUF6445 family protein [Sphingomonas japonica]|uniref:Phytanoyl-CoA dioxygenase (PhyH) n=2 Tax=Sphingomonas japonica TaxID=511662 RepID=A0ABX0U0X9_9SPHN|nr:DUF6445 family protein [Sphingomonas japonica]NIJ23047.1 hypothetical protein [Sphingomonas japonica]
MNRHPLDPACTATRHEIGVERQPLLILDRVLADPMRLVAAATSAAFAPAYGAAGGYPGVRAPAPLDYVEAVARSLLPVLIDGFALPRAKLRRAECNFSLVTLPPDRLHASQRAPHIDTVDPWQFAILHYLCGPEHGGTAFFRHRATGFETLSADRLPAYDEARARDADGDGYIVASDAGFDMAYSVDAAFDRLIVYRSCLLHSGRIGDPSRLSSDPRRGRLTANIFLTLRPG